MYVTHLECSLTGERYPAGQAHNLSKAGKPLLVRYDLERARQTLTRESAGAARAGHVEMARAAAAARRREPVSLGEPETPIVPLAETAAKAGASNLLVKDEGRLPTGSFKARGLAMAVTMAKQFGIERDRAFRPTAMPAPRSPLMPPGRGWRRWSICPAETPEINVRETAAYGARVYVADGQIDECGRAGRRRARPQGCGSTARRSRSRTASRARR